MFQLIYCSSARHLLSKQELVDILIKARDKNSRLGITGMLLYKDGNFMQLLEGEENIVRKLYETIVRDKRHHQVTLLISEAAEERLFPDWTMGFQDLSDPELDLLPGFSPFRKMRLNSSAAGKDAKACLDLLRFFRDSR